MSATLHYPPAALRREDAAAYISISPRKLDDLQRRGEIIPIDVDGIKRYSRAELDRYIDTRPCWAAR